MRAFYVAAQNFVNIEDKHLKIQCSTIENIFVK